MAALAQVDPLPNAGFLGSTAIGVQVRRQGEEVVRAQRRGISALAVPSPVLVNRERSHSIGKPHGVS